MAIKIQVRRGLSSEWSSYNPILALGEQGLETDTRKTKFGDGVSAWNSLQYSVDKSQIGLGNVDNTSDLNKPISTATQSALNAKADASSVYTKTESNASFEPKNSNIQSHIASSNNPHSVTKSQIGLGSVDNTSDLNKPISNATQSALDLKANSNDVSTSLSLKANSADVYTKSEVDSISTNTLDFANNYTDTKTAAIVNSAPETLDTLNELASALGNDPNFATTTATLIGTKANSADVYTKLQSDANFEPKNLNIQSHIANLSNPHEVTKAQVGLGNVNNTSDANKPISIATQSALDLKVDKVTGKGLSTEDFSTAEKTKLAGIQAGATANQSDAFLLSRSNHTGTQLASTISDFTSAVQAVTIDAAKIDGGVVSNAEFATLDGINTGTTIQSQINGKQSTGNYITNLTGDVTASGPGSVSATLSNTGVSAGTYDKVTVDLKGRVSAGFVGKYIYVTTATQSTTIVAYSAITQLTSAALPIGLYKTSLYIISQSAATTTGLGLRIGAGTATLTTISSKLFVSQAADGTAKNFQIDQLAANTNVTSTATLAANTSAPSLAEGVFRVTVAGTVQIEFRTEVAGSAVTIQPDSVWVIEAIN